MGVGGLAGEGWGQCMLPACANAKGGMLAMLDTTLAPEVQARSRMCTPGLWPHRAAGPLPFAGVSPQARPKSPHAPPAAVATGSHPAGSQQSAGPAAPQPLAVMPMYAELQVLLEGLHATVGVVADKQGLAGAAAGGAGAFSALDEAAGPGSQQQQQQFPGAAPDLEGILRQLRDATASNDVEAAAALQQQLATALAASGASGEQAQVHLPAYEVHTFAELRVQQLQVSSMAGNGRMATSDARLTSWSWCGGCEAVVRGSSWNPRALSVHLLPSYCLTHIKASGILWLFVPRDAARLHVSTKHLHFLCCRLPPLFMQVAVASVDATISGVAVELQQLALRRSTAAAPLLAHVLSPNAGGGRQAVRRALSAAAAAAGSSAWVEVVSLDPQQTPEPDLRGAQPQAAQKQLAVSVHFFDSAAGPGAAPPSGALAPGQLRCSVALGRVLLAHAPCFVTSMLLLAKQYQVGASWQPGGTAAAAGGPAGSSTGSVPAVVVTESAEPTHAGRDGEPLEHSSSNGVAGSGSAHHSASTPSLLAQALQPQLLLECRVAELQLLALSSQAPQAAALAVLLQQLELRSGALNWEAPWNSRLRHALLAPPQGKPGRLRAQPTGVRSGGLAWGALGCHRQPWPGPLSKHCGMKRSCHPSRAACRVWRARPALWPGFR